MKAKDLAKILLENPELEVCYPNPNDSGYDVIGSVEVDTVVPTNGKRHWMGDYQFNYGPEEKDKEIKVISLV